MNEQEKMQHRIECLSRITTGRGATTNEEQIAQRKIKLLQEMEARRWRFKQAVEDHDHMTERPTEVEIYPPPTSDENDFRKKFAELRAQNKKRWGIK